MSTFLITARTSAAVTTAIGGIPESAWQPVTCDRPVYDEDKPDLGAQSDPEGASDRVRGLTGRARSTIIN